MPDWLTVSMNLWQKSRDEQEAYLSSFDMVSAAKVKVPDNKTIVTENEDPAPKVLDNPWVQQEKNRILEQERSSAYSRLKNHDYFAIGTVYLNIPPTQISVASEPHNYRYGSLRSPGEVVLSSGRSTTRIELEIVFNGKDDINNKLRPLLAQFKTTPFLPIENEYISAIINPHGDSLINVSYSDAKKEQLARLERQDLNAKKLLVYSGKSEEYLRQYDNMADKVLQGNPDSIRIRQILRNPSVAIPGETLEEDYVKDPKSGAIRFDKDHYLRRKISVPGNKNLFISERTLSEMENLAAEIRELDAEATQIGFDMLDSRFKDKQIVCVLSQMSVSTVPGYPEMLGCKLSLYVFNYEPFAMDYLFISGYNQKSNATPDITKCDMFIDWYSKRWLADRADEDNPPLGTYESDPSMEFVYAQKIDPYEGDQMNKSGVEGNKFTVDKGMVVTGITVSIKNIIQFLPILSCKNPTCQYMGSMNTDVHITMESINTDKVKELSGMIETMGKVSRENNRWTRYNFINARNSLLSFMAMKFFVIDNYSVETVPGNPGLSTINLSLIEYKPNQERFQRLTREGYTSQEEIVAAAKWMLQKARQYAMDKTSGHINTKQYESIYNQVMDKNEGWFSEGSNMIASFVNGVTGGRESSMQLREKILNESPNRQQYKVGNLNSANGQDDPMENLTKYASIDPAFTQDEWLLHGNSPLSDIGTGIVDSLAGLFPGPTITERFGDLLVKKDYNAYGRIFAKSLQSNPNTDSFYTNHLDTVAEVAGIMRRTDIVDRIVQTDKSYPNAELNGYLNDHVRKSKRDYDAGKEYCYPDLELPKYVDLPEGYRFRNTIKECGIPHNDEDANKSIQSENANVDADFYMYRGSLWKSLDEDYNTTMYVDRGLNVYKKLALTNKLYRRRDPGVPGDIGSTGDLYSEDDFSRFLANYHENKANYKYDASSMVDSELRDIVDKKWFTVVYVDDGDTVSIENGSTAIEIRLLGYDALETKESVDGKKKVTDLEAALRAKDLLSWLVLGKEVKVMLGDDGKDEYGRLLANLLVELDGELVDVSTFMMSMNDQFDLKMSKFSTATTPLDDQTQYAFYKSHENWLQTTIADRLEYNRVIGAPWKGITDVASIAGKIAFSTSGEAEKNSMDVTGILAQKVSGIPGVFNALFPENYFTNNVAEVAAQKITERTNNKGIRRFDREGEKNINLSAKKIRESQKDDVLSMSRAFPTFKIYFIEEDMPEYGVLNDYYSYQAVQSIEVTRSRTDPADTAIVTLFNTRGALDRSLFGLYSSDGTYIKRHEEESYDPQKQETKDEQNLEEFVLKVGTIIKIKMGYHSDPDLLDTVFTGMVAEVTGGDIVTIVAQGFGVELLHKVTMPGAMAKASSAYQMLDKIISSPDTLHFGKLVWLPQESATTRKIYRRSIPDPSNPKNFIQPAWWRDVGGMRFLLKLADDTRNNNIWTPEHSFQYDMTHGGFQNFVMKDRSIWDIFRDMMRRMPGYITAVLPFDDRATIYFGPADFMYWYTDRNHDELRDYRIAWNQDLLKTDNEKIADLKSSYGFDEVDFGYVRSVGNALGNHLSRLANGDYKGNHKFNRVMGLLQQMSDTGKPLDVEWSLSGEFSPADEARKYLEIVVPANEAVTEEDRLAVIGAKMVADSLASGRALPFKMTQGKRLVEGGVVDKIKENNFTFSPVFIESDYDPALLDKIREEQKNQTPSFFNKGSELSMGASNKLSAVINGEVYYKSSDGRLYSRSQALLEYDSLRSEEHRQDDPSRKLVRQYHFKDSYHHIISNNITATAQYMYNKVTVEFGLENTWIGKKIWRGQPSIPKISTQIDDDIWPEKIKEKVVQEVNARDIVVAWNYALGNLWEEARKMYSGHLTILGDGSIKPYDFIMISDYYTDMFGPIEVEQVTHHFTPETGFVTTIVPNLVCYVNNTLQQGSMTVAGAYMDGVSDWVQRVRGRFSFGGFLPALGNTAARVAFWMTGLSVGRREPISFTPLLYAGRPYIAGVEGMRKNSLVEAFQGRIQRFIFQKNRIWDTWKQVRDQIGIRAENLR